MTGDSRGFEGITPLSLESADWKVGDRLFVASDRLRLRSSNELKDENIIDVLDKNEEVIVTKKAEAQSELVFVTVPASLKKGYVGRAYLSLKKAIDPLDAGRPRYFLIQNIATEKTRLYRKCDGDNCKHELLLQTENVIGGHDEETRTWLGSFKITNWFKFYEDYEGRYPAWYDPRYNSVPSPTDPLSWWFARSFMPKTAKPNAEIRGAFGWFAAYLSPDVSAQWIHGTFGWGSQKKIPLQNTRSHGCTRFDNESVAYLRHMLRVGTQVIRIYAEESDETFDGTKPGLAPSEKWQYILTKDDAQSDRNEDIDRENVLRLKIPQKRWLEEGTYQVNKTSSVHQGNPYRIPREEFRGKLLVNEGRLSADYRHPKSLAWGGYRDKLIPNEMLEHKSKKQTESLR